MHAGLFHATTGYSLPMAVALAVAIARQRDLTGEGLARWVYDRAQAHWRGQGYYRMLSRMLFDAARPDTRYRIFERFYRLPEPLIERFYAGRSTIADKFRILCGRPPVPIRAAMQALIGKR
jgi:lycopene beta-cyclase